ncbi:MAG: succinylglutamate desuccinylase [Gammaproteobacteria bacterium]|nr:succinylglutamate desuccinylase [Gammaproteobacteria bacterium]MBU2057935.1 succinylglutamate desuccinylase [Gammaproteobacteria bacterium]MBU2174287.1 succinylglutamate desuccinylase [Gammaproteobacteria bacterium]MBU2247763.1 succinylglutamate desuccinylase [Gammaproteobacteria bacterium]MBU2344288.1 succinylglutamate desuccinylase [Gammaproteobacteria bacterium]
MKPEVMLQQLQQSPDFLKLTLAHPDFLPFVSYQLENGTAIQIWDTGVIYCQPKQFGQQDIVLSSGVHGNETAPVELCSALLNDVLAGKLLLTERVLFLFGNPPAMNAGVREIQDNLNRLFSGHHSKEPDVQSAERDRAKKLETYVLKFFEDAPEGLRERKLYDLHTAIRGSRFEKFVVYPFLHGENWSKNQFEFLKACGANTVLLMQTPASTFSYFAAQSCKAHGFTIELGKARPFGENDMSRFAEAATALRSLISGGKLATTEFNEADFNLYEVRRSINKSTEAFQLHFADSIENFTSFDVGTVLASDQGVEYKVEVEGEAVIFPNPKVAIGQRAMLMVKPVSVAGKVS